MLFRIRRGLDVPIGGAPRQVIEEPASVSSVGVLVEDHRGLRPQVLVQPGARVALGQPLVADRRRPEIVLTSPGAGVVAEVRRAERRALRSVVVQLEDGDGDANEVRFEATPRAELARLDGERVTARLLAAGLWVALRQRPFDRLPAPGDAPRSIFVTAIDTNPLAADPAVVIAERARQFADGLTVLSRLTPGPVHLCKAAGAALPSGDPARVTVSEFAGPHPAGLVGTHVHFLDPVGSGSAGDAVWHVGYQDAIAIGALFTTGRPPIERVVSLAGPVVERPRLLRTRLGADVSDLVEGELLGGACRVLSGSVLAGRQATGWGRFLGRHHLQVCALPEPARRARRRQRLLASTALRGRPTAFVPTGAFERVVPLDVLPGLLLRALLVGDDETARALGALELGEEDLALCTYVCPGKQEYGPLLAAALRRMEEEGG